MEKILLVALGGGAGAVCRYLVSVWSAQHAGSLFPWGTLIVNVAGSLAMGIVFEIARLSTVSPSVRSFVAVGFLGAFTTFSTFSLETVNLLADGEVRLALINAGASLVFGVAAILLGIFGARLLLGGLR